MHILYVSRLTPIHKHLAPLPHSLFLCAHITDAIEGKQLLKDRLEKAALSLGLVMNDSKTKFMTVRCEPARGRDKLGQKY